MPWFSWGKQGPWALVAVLAGCSAGPLQIPTKTPPDAPAVVGAPSGPAPRFREVTRSPWAAEPAADPRAQALREACGEPDGALDEVAAEVAKEAAGPSGEPSPDRVTTLLRQRGEPHVRPRILHASAEGRIDAASVRRRAEELRRSASRCGAAFASSETAREHLVVIAIDALADLDPLPTQARTGAWLTFSSTVRVPITAAKLVVLGPRGAPRTVPTSIDRRTGRALARFALDRPGPFLVQLVGERASGPEPLLEARIFADVPLPTVPPPGADLAVGDPLAEIAPGEDSQGPDEISTLDRMTAALRTSEALGVLRRDRSLDLVAEGHVARMIRTDTVAHDVGEGNVIRRLEAAGLVVKEVGENVARADSVALAHRALHASPSHRMNLLAPYFTHLGLALARAPTGKVFVCQVFATFPSHGPAAYD